jgi:serine/threonine protein kinase
MLIHHVGWPSFVKVIDFGIARAIGGPGHGTKGLLGTLGYIAPEQTESSRLPDVRSDLYALGCLAYELATGRLPFHGITHQSAPLDILEAHLGGTPTPIMEHRPDINNELGTLIMRLLARDPSARPSSAGELILPLNELRVSFLREGPKNRLAGIAPQATTKLDAFEANQARTHVEESSSDFLSTSDDTHREGPITSSD